MSLVSTVCNVHLGAQASTENVTPAAAAMKAGRDVMSSYPSTSAFRNVSYQRATHDSMLGEMESIIYYTL